MRIRLLFGYLAALAIALAPQAGADGGEGIVMGGTGVPTPTQASVEAANALMHDFGWDGNSTVLTTPESSISYTGDYKPLENAVAVDEAKFPGQPIEAFGYSQSADIGANVAPVLKGDPNFSYFMVGDADNPNGGYLTDHAAIERFYGTLPTTPANMDGIPTTNVSIGYDQWADQPEYSGDAMANTNASDGTTYGHDMYLGLTPQELSNAVTTTDGNITYVDVNNNSLPYLDSDIVNATTKSSMGLKGDIAYDSHYAEDKVQIDAAYGHLDTISNGEVISPTGNEFNAGDPGTVTTQLSGKMPASITTAEYNSAEAAAKALDTSNAYQMTHDTPAEMAVWDASGENPAYNAAVQMNDLLASGVDAGQITPAQELSIGTTMFSGFDTTDPMFASEPAASAASETAPQIAAELAPHVASETFASLAGELPSILASLF